MGSTPELLELNSVTSAPPEKSFTNGDEDGGNGHVGHRAAHAVGHTGASALALASAFRPRLAFCDHSDVDADLDLGAQSAPHWLRSDRRNNRFQPRDRARLSASMSLQRQNPNSETPFVDDGLRMLQSEARFAA